MHRSALSTLVALSLAGCSSSFSDLSTGSLFNSSSSTPAPAAATASSAPAAEPATPTTRALHVGAVTARAIKCGYNFDPARLKASYIASETALGTSAAEMANLEKVYNVAFNGVNKAAAEDTNYCSEKKTSEIKADLGRLLAGDFTPPAKKQVAQGGGMFDWLNSGDTGDNGPAYGSQDWWDKQADKAGH